MRILLSYVTVGRGGDAVQLLALCRALRSQGHETSLVGASPVRPYVFDTLAARARSLIRRMPWWARDTLEFALSFAAAGRATRVAQARSIDLVIHRAAVYDFVIGRLARRRGVPLVLYLDAHVESERAFRGEAYWRRFHASAMRSLGRAATVIVTPSRAVAAYYIGLGLPAAKIVVRRNGVSAPHLALGREAATAHPPLQDPTRCTLGFVGSLSRWHGVDLLLEALHYLRNGAPHADVAAGKGRPVYRLIIVGRGSEYHALQARARRLGVDDAVEWRGSQRHDDAVRSMGEFDIAILPNTLHTGAPMKLSEYAAMARPIIAPDRPNIHDMFTDGEEIVTVPAGDSRALARAIAHLAASPEQARRMGHAAQLRVTHETWEETVDLLIRRATERVAMTSAAPAYATVAEVAEP
jgi:glycosyltransferase involved in cell wall biosynthesis